MTQVIVRDPETGEKVKRDATADELAEIAALVKAPDQVTKLQLVRHLRDIGKWDAAKVLIDADPVVAEDWQLAHIIPRNSQTVAAMAAALEIDVDAAFIAAAQL